MNRTILAFLRPTRIRSQLLALGPLIQGCRVPSVEYSPTGSVWQTSQRAARKNIANSTSLVLPTGRPSILNKISPGLRPICRAGESTCTEMT